MIEFDDNRSVLHHFSTRTKTRRRRIPAQRMMLIRRVMTKMKQPTVEKLQKTAIQVRRQFSHHWNLKNILRDYIRMMINVDDCAVGAFTSIFKFLMM